jgi:hypothetical protein
MVTRLASIGEPPTLDGAGALDPERRVLGARPNAVQDLSVPGTEILTEGLARQNVHAVADGSTPISTNKRADGLDPRLASDVVD